MPTPPVASSWSPFFVSSGFEVVLIVLVQNLRSVLELYAYKLPPDVLRDYRAQFASPIVRQQWRYDRCFFVERVTRYVDCHILPFVGCPC